MFEMMFVFLFVAFMIVFLMFCKKLLVHFEKESELKQKEIVALVNIDNQLEKLNVNFCNFEMNGDFKK